LHQLARPARDELPAVIAEALSVGRSGDPARAISIIVAFAERVGDQRGEAMMALNPVLQNYHGDFANFYAAWILEMEKTEAKAAMSRPLRNGSFRDRVGASGAAAYDRVGDLFIHCDLSKRRTFVLVGAGALPVTALHVHDRTNIQRIECVDTRREAVDSVAKLSSWLRSDRLRPCQEDGAVYDYSLADVVYIANMVTPKWRVIARVLETASPHTIIVLRNPYSLGRLWAEDGEAGLDTRLRVTKRGRGSRYLSRDLYLERSGS
jgi:hypothetical protein